MNETDSWQARYDELKTMPWSIVQPILAGLHLILLLIPSLRPTVSLLIEAYQMILLIVFGGLAIESMGMKLILLLQFSQFKIMDVTYSNTSSKAWLGYYPQLIDNAFAFILIMIILLLIISFSTCFFLKSITKYVVRLFYRFLILGFMPITLYFVLAVKSGGLQFKGEFYVSVGIFVVYMIISLICVVRYLPRRKIANDWDFDTDPTNTLEFRVNLQHNGKSREYFNVAIAPAFKILLVLWTCLYTEKSSVANLAVIGVSFLMMIVYLAVIRPFTSLMHNMYAIGLYLATGLVFVFSMLGRYLDVVKVFGSYAVIGLLSLMIMLAVGAMLLGIKKGKNADKKPANQILATMPESERSDLNIMGALPVNRRRNPMVSNAIAPMQARGLKKPTMNNSLFQKSPVAGNNRGTRKVATSAGTLTREAGFTEFIGRRPQLGLTVNNQKPKLNNERPKPQGRRLYTQGPNQNQKAPLPNNRL